MSDTTRSFKYYLKLHVRLCNIIANKYGNKNIYLAIYLVLNAQYIDKSTLQRNRHLNTHL